MTCLSILSVGSGVFVVAQLANRTDKTKIKIVARSIIIFEILLLYVIAEV